MFTETKQKNGSQHQACSHDRLLNTQSERRLVRPSDTLYCIGYGNWQPVQKPPLSALNNGRHLQFEKEHKHWTVDDWKKVIWSNKSIFYHIMQMPGCEYGEENMKAWTSTAFLEYFKLMEAILWFWGLFWHCMGPLIPLSGTSFECPRVFKCYRKSRTSCYVNGVPCR